MIEARSKALPLISKALASLTKAILGGIGVSGRLAFSLNYIEQVKDNGLSPTEDMIRIRNRALEYLGFPEKANDDAV